MYIALATRPDISFAIATLSRYNSKAYNTDSLLPKMFYKISEPPTTIESTILGEIFLPDILTVNVLPMVPIENHKANISLSPTAQSHGNYGNRI
jgi:hypothetical protein